MLKGYKIRYYEKKVKTMTKEEAKEYLTYKEKNMRQDVWKNGIICWIFVILSIAQKDNKFLLPMILFQGYYIIITIKILIQYHHMKKLIRDINKP